MLLDGAFLSTQIYKVQIHGKVEQSWERNGSPPLHLGVVVIEKGAFGSLSPLVSNLQVSSVDSLT